MERSPETPLSVRSSLAALALAVALVLVGCGEDYETEAQAALEPISTSGIGQAARAATRPEDLAAATADIQDTYAAAVDDLEALEPPNDAVGAHDQLVAALQDFSEALGAVGDAAAAGDRKAIQRAATDLLGALPNFQEQIASAQAEFSDEGIELDLVPNTE